MSQNLSRNLVKESYERQEITQIGNADPDMYSMFLGLPDLNPSLFCTDPDPNPDLDLDLDPEPSNNNRIK